jgi:sugar lactone lactonase YvrE
MTHAPCVLSESKSSMSALCWDGKYDEIVEFVGLRYRLGNFAAAAACTVLLLHAYSVRAEPVTLEEVAAFPSQQVTGVTVSAKGRVFVNFPFWSDDHTISVAEVVKGKLKPFPDDTWNEKDGPPAQRWICVQSVVVDDQDALWVLDPASPKTEAVVKGGPKLVKFDLVTNKVTQAISFDEDVAPERSYLNDVRLDTKTGHAFITESGTGAIIVVDLKSGKARRVLGNDPSTKLEPKEGIVVDGMKIIDPKTGNAPAFQADGIAFDKENGWLYYHALTGKTMYRIKTEYLLDESLSPEQLGTKVENLGATPKPDGMLEGNKGIVFLTAIEENAIARFDPQSRNTSIVIQDKRLQWPDTMAWGPDGKLYVTTSQIHRMPKYHGGVSQQQGPYMVYRMKLP